MSDVGTDMVGKTLRFRGVGADDVWFPIAQSILWDDLRIVRLGPPDGVGLRYVFERAHVFALTLSGAWLWYAPTNRHGNREFHGLSRRNAALVMTASDGWVVEVAPRSGDVLAMYHAALGPDYQVDGDELIFRAGRRLRLPQPIAETLDCGEFIVVRTSLGQNNEQSQVFGISKAGTIAWRHRSGEWVGLTPCPDGVCLCSFRGFEEVVDPATGKVRRTDITK